MHPSRSREDLTILTAVWAHRSMTDYNARPRIVGLNPKRIFPHWSYNSFPQSPLQWRFLVSRLSEPKGDSRGLAIVNPTHYMPGPGDFCCHVPMNHMNNGDSLCPHEPKMAIPIASRPSEPKRGFLVSRHYEHI